MVNKGLLGQVMRELFLSPCAERKGTANKDQQSDDDSNDGSGA